MTETSSPRYAIYYEPAPEHPLTIAARAWLGREAFAGGSLAAPIEPVATENHVQGALTAAPRRYGFHATLKAPFRLKEGCSVEELEQALCKFVATWPACPIGPLKIGVLGGCFALAPVSPIPTLRGLASRIVTEFDRFRSPMSPGELRRRLRLPLNETETIHLVRWGYPYVFDSFRFHMTLTDQVPAENRSEVGRELDAVFASLLREDFSIDALSLFVQEHSDADFVMQSQFALKSRALLKAAV